jgi:hypothetical protein
MTYSLISWQIFVYKHLLKIQKAKIFKNLNQQFLKCHLRILPLDCQCFFMVAVDGWILLDES